LSSRAWLKIFDHHQLVSSLLHPSPPAVNRAEKYQFKFACAVALCALVANWLIGNENSPLYEFLWDSFVANWWSGMNLMPYLFAIITSGAFHGFSDSMYFVGLIVQWFVVGLILFRLGLSLKRS
jgi:hypothetical protein